MIGDRTIEDLPIGFTAVATDIIEQKEIWLTHGSLFDAIRASIAVPMIFSPVKLSDRVLCRWRNYQSSAASADIK